MHIVHIPHDKIFTNSLDAKSRLPYVCFIIAGIEIIIYDDVPTLLVEPVRATLAAKTLAITDNRNTNL